MVKKDITDGNLYLANTEDFLTKLFPVDASIVDQVYETLTKKQGTYNLKKKLWKGLPIATKQESSYYQPFVDIVESIRVASESLGKVTLCCRWIDRHSKYPKSRDQDAAIIRPDILCVLKMEGEEQKKWEGLGDIEEREKKPKPKPPVRRSKRKNRGSARGGGGGGRQNTGGEEGEAKDEKEDNNKSEQQKEMAAWWLRVNVPIEVQPVESKGVTDHIERLLGYMRQVLEEQADRYFVPGLLLSQRGLQIWLCDRSGVVGTPTPIDIHKNPKSFIRVILGCSLLPPERLGWDPTMRLCRQPINPQCPESVHSYDPSVKLSDYHNSLYESNWVIEMPSKTDPMKREEYITVRALSVVRAECMSGRATIVWAVIKVDDMKMKDPPHYIYVLKQCWRPTAGNHEGDFFPEESKTRDIHLGRMHSYEDVKYAGDVMDTQKFIRQGLDHFLPSVDVINANGKRMTEALQTAEGREAYLDITLASDQARVAASTCDLEPIWRTFARALSEDYGWSMKEFRDILELLKVSDHLITAHEFLHFYGVLHRDISSGNAVICPVVTDGVMTTEGRLIDLDYAKRTERFVSPVLFHAKRKNNAPSKDPARMEACRLGFQATFEEQATDDVVDVWKSSVGSFTPHITTILGYNPNLKNSTITGYDIGLLEENKKLPDFSTHTAQNRQRSATLPYASSEILSEQRMFPVDGIIAMHKAVHDLEAFFWVIVCICITRCGPGGARREELRPGTLATQETQQLFLIVDCFFYTEKIHRLEYNKRKLFTKNDFVRYVLPHVHPYFERLKPLLVRWWKILRIAHQLPSFETIHEWFLDALRDTISEFEKHPSEIHPYTANVDASRQQDLRSLQYFPNLNRTSQESRGATWDSSPSRDMLSHSSRDYRGRESKKPTPQDLLPQGPPPPQDLSTPTRAPTAKRLRRI